jgi:hypothetical protein
VTSAADILSHTDAGVTLINRLVKELHHQRRTQWPMRVHLVRTSGACGGDSGHGWQR